MFSSDGTAGVGLALRSWSTPSFVLGLNVTADARSLGRRAPRRASAHYPSARLYRGPKRFLLRCSLGLSVQMENCGNVRFERPSSTATFSVPSIEAVVSSEEAREARGIRPRVLSLPQQQEGAGRVRFTLDAAPEDRGAFI